MNQIFADAVSALRFVPETMRKRALALADALPETDRAELLLEMQHTNTTLKKNAAEQEKILSAMEVIVTDMEKRFLRVERGETEAKDRQQDMRRADDLLTNES